MKRLLAVFLIWMLFLSGCAQGGYRDDQVYIVNKDRKSTEKEELLDWLALDGPKPFKKEAQTPLGLLAGEVPLYVDEAGEVAVVMQNNLFQNPSLRTAVLAGHSDRSVNLLTLQLSDGQRQVVASESPFVHKSVLDKNRQQLYLGGGGQLQRLDLRRLTLTPVAYGERSTQIRDFFVSPVESGKIYLDIDGLIGGAMHYPDSARNTPLYQTRGRLYYKDTLEGDYYYATEWRSEKDDGGKERLYTVVADLNNRVVRVLARGAYRAAYGKQVLIGGDNGFGLSVVTDINNVSESHQQLTEGYVYDAGFYANGKAYWIGDNGRQNWQRPEKPGYLLHLIAADGHEERRLPLSGSTLFVDVTGRTAYSSGPAAETVDLNQGKITDRRAWQQPLTADAALSDVLFRTSADAVQALLGDEAALKRLLQQATSKEVQEDMRNAVKAPAVEKSEVHLDMRMRNAYLVAGAADFTVLISGSTASGRWLQRQLHVRYFFNGGAWKIETFRLNDAEETEGGS